MEMVLYLILGLAFAIAFGIFLLVLYMGWVVLVHDIEDAKEAKDGKQGK